MLKETQMPGRTTNLCAAFGTAHLKPTEQFWYHNAGTSGLGGSSCIDDIVRHDS